MKWHDAAKKDEVRMLRLSGLSLGQIQEKVKIPKTTVYEWIRDISLTAEQKAELRNRAWLRLQEGNKKARQIKKLERVSLQEKLLAEGIMEVGKLSDKELFIAGVSLYWAEGFKTLHERRLGFCNSDPTMIRFYLHWLDKSLNINKKDLVARLTINVSYMDKTDEIIKFWSSVSGIPKSQFTKTFYQKSIWKKQYNTDNYFGVLRIHVRNSLKYILLMRGWIQGLRLSMPG
jgi:hypothetical protein